MHTCRGVRNFVCAGTIVESQHGIRLVATMHKNWRLDDGENLAKVCIELECIIIRVISLHHCAAAMAMSTLKAYILEICTQHLALEFSDRHGGYSCLYFTDARKLRRGIVTRYPPCVVSDELCLSETPKGMCEAFGLILCSVVFAISSMQYAN
jgi:hypothetical protein